MAKISLLPQASPLTGAETLPILQEGQNRKIVIEELISVFQPIADEAAAARDAVRPMYGEGPPHANLGITGSFYRDMRNPFSPLEWFKTDVGWQGPQSLKGDPGAADNVAGSLSQLKSAAITNTAMIFDGSVYLFEAGDYSARIDNRLVVASDHVAPSSGAWVNQVASSDRIVGFDIRKLDLVGFDATGAGGAVPGWNALTYSGWINGLQSHFALDQAVSRQSLGKCSDGVNDIYLYRVAGGPTKVFLVAGLHGEETLAQYATMRFIEWVTRSFDPLAKFLRANCTFLWIPTGSPSAYRLGRKNSNGVDPNRNFDFYWSDYVVTDPLNEKGPSAFSEPESRAVRDVIDAHGVTLFMDCHNTPADYADDMFISPPSAWMTCKAALVRGAIAQWRSVTGRTSSDINDPRAGNPNAPNWASKHLLYDLGRPTGASVTMEMPANRFGSVTTGSGPVTRVASAEAVSVYATFIAVMTARWLLEGQAPSIQPQQAIHARRVTPAATSISAGGTLLDQSSDVWSALAFETLLPFNKSPAPSLTNPRSQINVVYPCPGTWVITIDGYVRNTDTTRRQSFAVRINFNNAWQNESLLAVMVEPAQVTGAACDAPFTTTLRVPGQPGSISTFKIEFSRMNTSNGAVLDVRRCRVNAVFIPADNDLYAQAGVN